MTVLLVEDQAILAMSYQEVLQEAGIVVLGPVASAEEALLVASQTRPNIALIGVELRGEKSGVQLARTLKEKWGTAVVLVSGHPSSNPDFSHVAVGFLSKPFTDENLVETVSIARKVKAGERPHASALPQPLRLF